MKKQICKLALAVCVLFLIFGADASKWFLVAEAAQVCPDSPPIDPNTVPWIDPNKLDYDLMHYETYWINQGKISVWESSIEICCGDEDGHETSIRIKDGPEGAELVPTDANYVAVRYQPTGPGTHYIVLDCNDAYDANDTEIIALQVLLNKPPVMGCRKR